MRDTTVTVIGNVADSPRRNNLASGAVTNFRMASTARRYDAARQEFVDGGTFWVDVECWGALSGNVAGSLSKGDPVIVQGALTTQSWETDSGRRSKPCIKAFAVGPDLARGRSVFTRDQPRHTAADVAADTGGGFSPADEEVSADEVDLPGADDLQPGRDYVVAGETSDQTETDRPREPAHA